MRIYLVSYQVEIDISKVNLLIEISKLIKEFRSICLFGKSLEFYLNFRTIERKLEIRYRIKYFFKLIQLVGRGVFRIEMTK